MPYSSYCPGFDFSVLLHRGFLGAANEAVLNNVMKKKIKKGDSNIKENRREQVLSVASFSANFLSKSLFPILIGRWFMT
jgi:hypothetical protein